MGLGQEGRPTSEGQPDCLTKSDANCGAKCGARELDWIRKSRLLSLLCGTYGNLPPRLFGTVLSTTFGEISNPKPSQKCSKDRARAQLGVGHKVATKAVVAVNQAKLKHLVRLNLATPTTAIPRLRVREIPQKGTFADWKRLKS